MSKLTRGNILWGIVIILMLMFLEWRGFLSILATQVEREQNHGNLSGMQQGNLSRYSNNQ